MDFIYVLMNEYEQEIVLTKVEKFDISNLMGQDSPNFGRIVYAAEFENGRLVQEWECQAE